jgi:L-rhamnose isomerase
MIDRELSLRRAYDLACERYGEIGVDVEAALGRLATIAVSLHCWQGDDVGGFESAGETLGGGLAVTGHYPGRARTVDELRSDLETAYSLIPGRHRLNLHASYAETSGVRVDRDEVRPEHFAGWVDWAKSRGLGLDFNPTFFSHSKASDGFTLSHRDEGIRRFWIDHALACRRIGASFGEELGSACITNIWVPDGSKDTLIDRKGPRERLRASLDTILADSIDPRFHRDAVEAKLFGLGSESYVVGSHEFYLGYAQSREAILCLDAGHFHPTEVISDKLSAVLEWVDEILLHVSRGVRWDSDHVVTFTDELQAIAHEAVRGNYLDRIHFGLDYFDASINRVAAWVVGTRALLKALLIALLEPTEMLREMEANEDFTSRLAWLEELKSLPFGAVWDFYCESNGVPVGPSWLENIQAYEREELSKRTM